MDSNIVKGEKLNFSSCTFIQDFIEERIKHLNDRVAQVDYESGSVLTFTDIIDKSTSFSVCLRNKGISEHSVIAVCSNNCLEFCWVVLGILKSGAACQLLNPSSTPREIKHLMEITNPVLVMCPSDTAESVHDNGKTMKDTFLNIKTIREVIVWDNKVPGCTYLPDIMCTVQETNQENIQLTNGNEMARLSDQQAGIQQWHENKKEDDVAIIFNSSGSTGLPKCVALTHKNIISALSNSHIFISSENVALGLMPFHHAYGFILMLMCLCEGAKVITMPHFSKIKFVRSIEKYKINCLHLVPYLLVMLCKDEAFSNIDLQSICQIWTGAGPVSSKIQQAIQERLNGCGTLNHSYGMTETTFVMFCAECRVDKPQSCGKLIPGMECKVVDINSSIALGPRKTGEICFRGPMITSGYIGNETATKETIDSEGWLHSGDLGYYDQDKYFFIVDRLKEIIKYKGHQISPTELESVLSLHSAVQDAAVIGVAHELYGELPCAMIVKKQDVHVTEKDIQDFVSREVAPYKALRGGVKFVATIPRTSAGKIQRRLLHDII